MSGLTDSIRERRAREIRTWEEEDGDEATPTTGGSLGLLCAQRFLHVDEQVEAVRRILEGRLSLEYLSWNGRC
jgi:hypothetical protein